MPESGGDVPIDLLRRLFAIFLLAAFVLPFLTPLLAYGAVEDMSLPACCRKNGKHHCSMGLAIKSPADQRSPRIGTVSEKCPCCPALVQSVTTHPKVFTVGTAKAVFAAWVSHPCGVAQTESKRRISRDRSRQKRGPPTITFA